MGMLKTLILLACLLIQTVVTLNLTGCGESADTNAPSTRAETIIEEGTVRAAFQSVGRELLTAMNATDLTDLVSLMWSPNPQDENAEAIYVALFKTEQAATEYARGDVGFAGPNPEVRRVRNVAIYVPRGLNDQATRNVDRLEALLRDRAHA